MVNLAWLSAALPVVGAAVKVAPGLFSRSAESRLEARTQRHLTLLRGLPDGVNEAPLRELVDEELMAVRDFHVRRLHRELDSSVLVGAAAALIICTVVAVVGWAVSVPSYPIVEVILRILGSIGGVVGLIVILAGSSTMWKSTASEPPTVSAPQPPL